MINEPVRGEKISLGEKQAGAVKDYESVGFRAEVQFRGEYVLLVNALSLSKVRVYEDGRVLESDPLTGVYYPDPRYPRR